MNVDQIETILELPHSLQKVWDALTTPEGLNSWFGDRVSMDLAPGRPILFEWDEYGEAGGTIEAVEPLSRFAYRWRATGVPEEEEMNDQNSTLVTFELSPIPSGTRLRVVETGFATLRPDLRENAFRENTSGWRSELAELITYLKGTAA